MLHGIPKFGKFLPVRIQKRINLLFPKIMKKQAYPRLILRFCAMNNKKIFNRGLDHNQKQNPPLNS